MSVAFEQVSYTYADPARLKKKRKRAEDERNNGEQKADWGNDPNENWALKSVTFSLEEGEFFGIAGHTGSGKSTLIQHMNGLLHPTSGRVTFDGADLAEKNSLQALRGRVGLVLQYPEHQLFAATVYDDVAFGPRNLGSSDEEVDALVRKALASVQLDFDELKDKSPFELSGGQQRRVAFAGVLAMEPRILVLDEPVAGLDPRSRSDFMQLIGNLHESGITIVMVSHNMDDLARMCDRILVLNNGEMFALGTPEEVFADEERLHDIGLGVPAVQHLANRLRLRGLDIPQRLFTEEALADLLGDCETS